MDTVVWENPTITIGVVQGLWRKFTIFGNVVPAMGGRLTLTCQPLHSSCILIPTLCSLYSLPCIIMQDIEKNPGLVLAFLHKLRYHNP